MPDDAFSKSEKKELRRLAEVAYERELGEALRDIASAFRDWEKKRVDAFHLSDLIHEFHDGESRELWSLYQRTKPDQLVGRAVALGIVERSEVSASLLRKLEGVTSRFERLEDDEE